MNSTLFYVNVYNYYIYCKQSYKFMGAQFHLTGWLASHCQIPPNGQSHIYCEFAYYGIAQPKGGRVKKDVLFIMKVWCIPPTVHLLGCLMNITTWWWFYCSFVCPASHIFIIQLSAWVVTCYLSVFPTSAKHKTAHEVEEAISLVREPHDPSIPDWIHMPSLS